MRGSSVLVARRRDEAPLGGLWEFPGGKVEDGETPEAALARELAEELEIGVSVGQRWGELFTEAPAGELRLRFYFATLESGTPRAVGCAECRWATPAEMLALDLPCPDRTVAEDLRRQTLRGAPLERARGGSR